MTLVQVYAPTSAAEDDEIERFYELIQSVINETPKGDIMYIMGDWNAKVGNEETNGITGKFVGKRNERGDWFVEFCSQNSLQILNTLFDLHARRLYTWTSPDQATKNQIDYTMCPQRWRSSVRHVTTLPGADCGTDHKLLVMEIRIRLKQIIKLKLQKSLTLTTSPLTLAVELKNRFNELEVEDREPDELWNEEKDIITVTS